MCLDCELTGALQREAKRRTAIDGIPRRVTLEGKIVKLDWELDPELLEDNLEGEALEEHIRKLIALAAPFDETLFTGPTDGTQ